MITRVEGVKTAVFLYGIHVHCSISGDVARYWRTDWFERNLLHWNGEANDYQRLVFDHYNTSIFF